MDPLSLSQFTRYPDSESVNLLSFLNSPLHMDCAYRVVHSHSLLYTELETSSLDLDKSPDIPRPDQAGVMPTRSREFSIPSTTPFSSLSPFRGLARLVDRSIQYGRAPVVRSLCS